MAYLIYSLGDGLLHIHILDIGQGDAMLIRTPAMEYILVDGGPDAKVLQEIAEVMPFYERTIDVMILSHPHADHIDGLIDVLERYDVRQVFITGVAYSYPAYHVFLDLLDEKGVGVVFAGNGKDFRLGNVIIDNLYPFEPVQGRQFSNLNNSSITFRLIYGLKKFYFSGDLEVEGEEKLVESGLDLNADVFKAGHHGSRTSSSEVILDSVAPDFAAISCGIDNSFKHPHFETIQNLQIRNIRIYRTDIDGRIEFISDGKEIWAL